MLTVFLKFLLFIWDHLLMNLSEPASTVANRVDCRMCSGLPVASPMMGLGEGRFWFERHMNLRLCTVDFQFSLHSRFCENSSIERRQVDFSRTKIASLFGAFWNKKRV